MPANSVIDLVSLDPTTNKQSYLQFLQSQSRFKGYDFAGDDLNIILDMFMINDYRYAFLLNMAISEGFLDSAQLLSDVRSHAKDLNYTPRSQTSSQANVTVNFQATGESQPYIIPKGSTFSSFVKNQNFTFSTAEQIVCASSNNSFSFTTPLYDGVYVKDSYIYNTALSNSSILAFKITNANADTQSLVVNVFGNNSLVGQNYNLTTSLLGLTANSFVYFLQCAADTGNYEVLFGDGIFGHAPLNGSLVILDYRLSQGISTNGASVFNINFDPTFSNEMLGSPTVITNSIASGAANAENIETTRFYAPRWFQTQERAIVPSDYEILLKTQFPQIIAVNAYGGETLTPPQFGKVVIALAISGVGGLPNSLVNEYTTFIKARNPLSIQPIFIAAQDIFLAVSSLVKYNINVTSESPNLLASLISTAINNYSNQNLNDFDVTFYLSQFTDMIDEVDPSIVSNQTTIKLYQKITPDQLANNYYLNYAVPLLNNISMLPQAHSNSLSKTVSSTNFFYKGNLSQLEDDGSGTIRIVNIEANNLIMAANTGSIDYNNGIVQLNSFAVDSFSGDDLLVYVAPLNNDVTATQNILLTIEPDQVMIDVVSVSL